MVPAYAAQARTLQARDPSAALAMLRKALRLDATSPDPKLRAEVDALEAVLLTERGVPDKFLAQRALERDPGNELARKTLAGLQDKAQEQASNRKRFFVAGGVATFTLALMGALLWWRPRRPKRDTSGAPSAAQASDGLPEAGASHAGALAQDLPEAPTAKAPTEPARLAQGGSTPEAGAGEPSR